LVFVGGERERKRERERERERERDREEGEKKKKGDKGEAASQVFSANFNARFDCRIVFLRSVTRSQGLHLDTEYAKQARRGAQDSTRRGRKKDGKFFLLFPFIPSTTTIVDEGRKRKEARLFSSPSLALALNPSTPACRGRRVLCPHARKKTKHAREGRQRGSEKRVPFLSFFFLLRRQSKKLLSFLPSSQQTHVRPSPRQGARAEPAGELAGLAAERGRQHLEVVVRKHKSEQKGGEVRERAIFPRDFFLSSCFFSSFFFTPQKRRAEKKSEKSKRRQSSLPRPL